MVRKHEAIGKIRAMPKKNTDKHYTFSKQNVVM
jgi:hypothetical protein